MKTLNDVRGFLLECTDEMSSIIEDEFVHKLYNLTVKEINKNEANSEHIEKMKREAKAHEMWNLKHEQGGMDYNDFDDIATIRNGDFNG